MFQIIILLFLMTKTLQLRSVHKKQAYSRISIVVLSKFIAKNSIQFDTFLRPHHRPFSEVSGGACGGVVGVGVLIRCSQFLWDFDELVDALRPTRLPTGHLHTRAAAPCWLVTVSRRVTPQHNFELQNLAFA